MSKTYTVKYIIWTETEGDYSDREFIYAENANRDEAIMMAKSIIDQYTIDHKGYENFDLNDHHFGSIRRQYTNLGQVADGIRAWIEIE